MTVTEGRPNGQLRNNEIFQAELSNDPNVGRGLIAAKIFEVEVVQTMAGPAMMNGTYRPRVKLSSPMSGYWTLARKA